PFNVVFANRWIFAPLVISEYEKIPEGNATIRTTLAWTMSQSGIKDNVLPSKATVTANLRILPGNTIESTLKEITGIIHDDRITIRVHPGAMEPIAASSTASEGYRQIQQAIHSTFPDAIVAPNLSIASTDSRHFASVAQQRFRFLPVRMDKDILSGMHGKNERVAVSAFMESILFYENLLGAQ
ncbi:MAG: peptidase dimerization domain-containing protein, partial [Flavobacteriales bacterium]